MYQNNCVIMTKGTTWEQFIAIPSVKALLKRGLCTEKQLKIALRFITKCFDVGSVELIVCNGIFFKGIQSYHQNGIAVSKEFVFAIEGVSDNDMKAYYTVVAAHTFGNPMGELSLVQGIDTSFLKDLEGRLIPMFKGYKDLMEMDLKGLVLTRGTEPFVSRLKGKTRSMSEDYYTYTLRDGRVYEVM